MKATVWTLQIQHISEETLGVFGSEVEARTFLRTFLADNWWRLPGVTMSEDLDQAAERYFELRPNESAAITAHEVKIAADSQVL